MSAPFPNIYTHRKVAEASAKACDICYKPSTSVLITPDKKVYWTQTPSPEALKTIVSNWTIGDTRISSTSVLPT
jgi:hypothetical protein